MSLLRWLLPLLCLLGAGCERMGSRVQTDEQKDPYYLAGKNRVQDRDYQGAIEMFEKALHANPRSASAHFELGILYEQQQADYAAALYHYQRAVMLNSNMPFADLGHQRMQECKRELAKSVVQPLSMEHLQRELDNTRAENRQLKELLQTWQNYYAVRGITLSNLLPEGTNAAPRFTPQVAAARDDLSGHGTRTNPTVRSNAASTAARVHLVVSGETLASIARKYNVRLGALQSANPKADARRLRPGQSLVIPSP
jgi:tetratricopeptide (TPR) repeat protein